MRRGKEINIFRPTKDKTGLKSWRRLDKTKRTDRNVQEQKDRRTKTELGEHSFRIRQDYEKIRYRTEQRDRQDYTSQKGKRDVQNQEDLQD
jgi:hypothetical protein